MVGHLEPLRGELVHVPPGAHLVVGVDGLEQRLEPAVAARRHPDPRLGDRLAQRLTRRLLGCRRRLLARVLGVGRNFLVDHALEFRGLRRVFLGVRFPAAGQLKVASVVPMRESLMAKCPNTRLTIPECSCSRCVEEQIRNAAARRCWRRTARRRRSPRAPLHPPPHGEPPPARSSPGPLAARASQQPSQPDDSRIESARAGLLSIERRDEVALVTLQRPEKRNALSIDLRVELARRLREPGRRRRSRLRRADGRRLAPSAPAWT